MKILVVGSGGREHAIVWALGNDPRVEKIFCAPGNAGIGQIAENIGINPGDIDGLAEFAAVNGVDLTVVGPEAPLSMGIVDHFDKRGLKAFGPVSDGARIEASKVWAKRLMMKYGIPTARYEAFDTLDAALDGIGNMTPPFVVKLDALAAGKGVLVAEDVGEARAFLNEAKAGVYGDDQSKVVIEEFLEGKEVSLLAFTDGKTIVPMVPARDHKRAYDGDLGPNTGGMGTVSPVAGFGPELVRESLDRILVPTLNAMAAEGVKYKGVLYAGLMITADGPKVLEFNCRFGDPETQVILPRLKTPLLDVLTAVVEERLDEVDLQWDDRACVCVVAASGGYPGSYKKGIKINGLDQIPDDAMVFHAGTALGSPDCVAGQARPDIVTAGGRVMGVASLGDSIEEAREKVYGALDAISFEGMFYRKDIGK